MYPMKIILQLLAFSFLFSAQPHQLAAQNDTAGEGFDKIFHTADLAGETATQASRRAQAQRTQALPDDSYRVGCECMSGEIRSTTGIGSCSGQGGVRYWLVVNAGGDTLKYPTARQALNADNEPTPYIGPSPQVRSSSQPTIIIMPVQSANGFAAVAPNSTSYAPDSQIVAYENLYTRRDSLSGINGKDKPVMLGIPHVLHALIQLCMLLVVCGTLIIITKIFLKQGTEQHTSNSNNITKRIRLTLIKILFRNNKL